MSTVIPVEDLDALVPVERNREGRADRAVRHFQKRIFQAQQEVGLFLVENGFKKMNPNCKKEGRISVTYPLHEAVKQNKPYIVAKLFLFGAKPLLRDHWGRVAFDYAHRHHEVIKVFEKFGCAPHSPCWRAGSLQKSPPPEGFEAFFASVGEDPMAVPNSEAMWLEQLGQRRLRSKRAA